MDMTSKSNRNAPITTLVGPAQVRVDVLLKKPEDLAGIEVLACATLPGATTTSRASRVNSGSSIDTRNRFQYIVWFLLSLYTAIVLVTPLKEAP